MNLMAGVKEDSNPPSQDKVDMIGTIMSLVLGFYILAVLVFITLRIAGIFKGKNKLEPITRKKIVKIIGGVLLGIPYILGIYLLPAALGGISWEMVIVWSPDEFVRT